MKETRINKCVDRLGPQICELLFNDRMKASEIREATEVILKCELEDSKQRIRRIES
jgi:hypothetical protein